MTIHSPNSPSHFAAIQTDVAPSPQSQDGLSYSEIANNPVTHHAKADQTAADQMVSLLALYQTMTLPQARKTVLSQLKDVVRKSLQPSDASTHPLADIHSVLQSDEMLNARQISSKSKVMFAQIALAAIITDPEKTASQPHGYNSFVDATQPIFATFLKHGGERQNGTQQFGVKNSLVNHYFKIAAQHARFFKDGLSDRKIFNLFEQIDTANTEAKIKAPSKRNQIRITPQTYMPFDVAGVLGQRQSEAEANYYQDKYLAFGFDKRTTTAQAAKLWEDYRTVFYEQGQTDRYFNGNAHLTVNQRAEQLTHYFVHSRKNREIIAKRNHIDENSIDVKFISTLKVNSTPQRKIVDFLANQFDMQKQALTSRYDPVRDIIHLQHVNWTRSILDVIQKPTKAVQNLHDRMDNYQNDVLNQHPHPFTKAKICEQSRQDYITDMTFNAPQKKLREMIVDQFRYTKASVVATAERLRQRVDKYVRVLIA